MNVNDYIDAIEAAFSRQDANELASLQSQAEQDTNLSENAQMNVVGWAGRYLADLQRAGVIPAGGVVDEDEGGDGGASS